MLNDYEKHAEMALENFAKRDLESRYLLVNAAKNIKVTRVLDVGCGAGQDMVPFIEKTGAFCVGIDIAEELSNRALGFFRKIKLENRSSFVRSRGEQLPFADESFEIVLCRVALPYMDNRAVIAEVARVLCPDGIFLLKTHAPAFYFGMIPQRLKKLSLKQIAYPLICLAGGTWHWLIGKQLQNGFWKGKEVFQTKGFLKHEFAKNNLKLESYLSDTNVQTPSLLIRKIQ
ncbi:MAG: class I SAM-dependent methyltransferase [Saprospiraceae bacterium]|nr:class I SAM-dependent methyltransferase [Pyrinomonadaceae bacterium]